MISPRHNILEQHKDTKVCSSPLTVVFLCSCEKVHHKQTVYAFLCN